MLLWTEALLQDNKCTGLIRLLIKNLHEACSILKIFTPADLSGLWKNLDMVSGGKKITVWYIWLLWWLTDRGPGQPALFWVGWAFPWGDRALQNVVSDMHDQLAAVASLLAPRQPLRKSRQQISEVIFMFFSCVKLKCVTVILYDRLLDV